MTDDPIDAAPSDHATLTELLDDLNEAGFGAQFVAGKDAQIECVSCGVTSHASRFDVHHTRRLEGASDPDDMLTVYAIKCPACDVGGTLVAGFGPNASNEDADVSSALPASPAHGADPVEPNEPG